LFAKSRQLKPLPNFGVQSNNQKLKKSIDSSKSFLYLPISPTFKNSKEGRSSTLNNAELKANSKNGCVDLSDFIPSLLV
jgi:hypothetical protein